MNIRGLKKEPVLIRGLRCPENIKRATVLKDDNNQIHLNITNYLVQKCNYNGKSKKS